MRLSVRRARRPPLRVFAAAATAVGPTFMGRPAAGDGGGTEGRAGGATGGPGRCIAWVAADPPVAASSRDRSLTGLGSGVDGRVAGSGSDGRTGGPGGWAGGLGQPTEVDVPSPPGSRGGWSGPMVTTPQPR